MSDAADHIYEVCLDSTAFGLRQLKKISNRREEDSTKDLGLKIFFELSTG